ncbi:MAG: non-canonical purine NTP pyrophosphatase [Gemmatimonadaceae bacterium]
MHSEIVIATRSTGKIRELTPMLSEIGFNVISLDDAGIMLDAREDDLEVFDTFEANALAKARWFFALGGGRPVLADDSGLAVDALDGRPGVRSKRWSGRDDLEGVALDEANNALLVKTLGATGVSAPWTAQYVCAAACVSANRVNHHHPVELVSTGHCDGAILREPRGAAGFGYDAYFLSANFARTFGEVSRDEKQRVSHRGRAFRSLVQMMQERGILASRNS